MFSQRLCIHVPRVPIIVRQQSRSVVYPSRQTRGAAQNLHGGLPLRFRGNGNQRQPSRAYSNYQPRGPPYHHDIYGQPPRSRVSRLKDMAIGSVLTVMMYSAYDYYEDWQLEEEIREQVEYANGLNEIFSHYHELEAEDDGSPESAEKIRRLFFQRAMDVTALGLEMSGKGTSVRDLGPLPELPESHELYESSKVDGKDTLVLLPPQPTAEDVAEAVKQASKDEKEAAAQAVAYNIVAAINASSQDLGQAPIGFTKPISKGNVDKFNEVCCRLGYVIDDLCKEGTFDADRPTLVTFFLRDNILMCLYYKGEFARIEAEALNRMPTFP